MKLGKSVRQEVGMCVAAAQPGQRKKSAGFKVGMFLKSGVRVGLCRPKQDILPGWPTQVLETYRHQDRDKPLHYKI